MWCRHCQQETPAIGLPGASGPRCSRCQRTSPAASDSQPAANTTSLDDGDETRRAAEVLKAGFRKEDMIARIGGDEFAVIMPGTDNSVATVAMERVQTLVELNNKYYGEPTLSISLGVSTGETGSDLEAIMRAADDDMYREKRVHHQGQ